MATGPSSKNLIEPRFHFLREQIQIGEDPDNLIFVTELVKKGQLLADYPDFKTLAAKGFEKSVIETGQYVFTSEDTTQILAHFTGYPRLEKKYSMTDGSQHYHLSIEPLIKISADRMKAYLNIHPPLANGACIHAANLQQTLAENQIAYGIDFNTLIELEDYLQARHPEFKSVLIAQGLKTIHGLDASLGFLFEIGPIPGKILKNGDIDFRERRILIPITEGQVIARKIPATSGTAGITVFGDKIEARSGKDIMVQTSHDAKFIAASNEVVAMKSGTLSVVGNNIIRVCAHQEIKGDIDYSTGNIESNNCLSIQGNVQPGFKVSSIGDLQITGYVNSAKISSQANIVIQGGITGENCGIESYGDVDISFIEQGQIQAGGTVVIRKQAYLAKIIAEGNILCRPDSKIIGGILIAGKNIATGNIGSESSVTAVLAAGVDAERFFKYQELKQLLINQQKAIIDWLEQYPGTNRSKKVRQMEEEAAATKNMLLRLNMIPGTGEFSRAGNDLENDDADNLDECDIDLHSLSIEIMGTVMSGTRLQIGNKSMKLDNTIANRLFKLDDNLKKIVAAPLKKKRS